MYELNNTINQSYYNGIQNTLDFNIPNNIENTIEIIPTKLYIYNTSKIYDGTSDINITISGLVNNQYIIYTANFNDPYSEINKLININISEIVEFINNNLICYYSFNLDTIQNNQIKDLVTLNYDGYIYNNIVSSSICKYGNASLLCYYSSFYPNKDIPLNNIGITFTIWIYYFAYIDQNQNIININNNILCEINQNDMLLINNIEQIKINTYNWYNITIILDISNNLLISYINSVYVSTSIQNVFNLDNNYLTGIGSNNNSNYFNGYIDEFKIYNYILPNNEIRNNYLYNYNYINKNIDLNNYIIPTNVIGNIFPKQLELILTIDKNYDGTPNAIIYTKLNGIINTENVYINTLVYGLYRDYNANDNIYVDISNIFLLGNHAQNYIVSFSLNSDNNLCYYFIFNIKYTQDNYNSMTGYGVLNIATNMIDGFVKSVFSTSFSTKTGNKYSLSPFTSPLYLYLNNGFIFNGFFTITTFIYLNSISNQNQYILTIIDEQLTYVFGVYVNNNNLYIELPNLNQIINITILSYIIWYHIAIVYDSINTTLNCLVDNRLLSIIDISNIFAIQTQYYISAIGGFNQVINDYNFNGYIDDFRLYNRILTQYELSRIYLYKNYSSLYNYLPIINNKLTVYGNINKLNLTITYLTNTTIYTGYKYDNFNITYTGFIYVDNSSSLIGNINYTASLYSNYYSNYYNNLQFNPLITVFMCSEQNSIKYTYSTNIIYTISDIFTSGNYMASNTDYSMFVSVGSGINTIAYSYNCIKWTSISSNIFTYGKFVTFINNTWFAGGSGTYTMAKSYDGISWTSIALNVFTTKVNSIITDGNIIIAGGSGNNIIAYSYDTIEWYGISGLFYSVTECKSIATNNTIWVAATNYTILYSYNIIKWYTDILSYGSYNHVIWDGIKFIACGFNLVCYSYNGINWIKSTNILNINYLNINYNGTIYLISTSSSTYFISSNNGILWNIINNIYPTNVNCIFKYNNIKYINIDQVINTGIYTITPTGNLYSQNYIINYNTGTITINKAKLYVYNNNYHKYYDGLIYNDYGVKYFGFLNKDTSNNLGGKLIYYVLLNNTKINSIINTGTYYITPSGLTSINYKINYNSYTITINKVNLCIIPNNDIKMYDASAYILNYKKCGIVNKDTSMNLINLTYNNQHINVNNYIIDISYTIILSNYKINIYSGLLNIIKAPLFVIANNDNIYIYNNITNYLLIYDLEYYIFQNNTITSLQNTFGLMRIWSLYGYQNSCQLSFSRPDNFCGIGLSEINYQTQELNVNQYIITVYSSYFTITEYNSIFTYTRIILLDDNFRIIYNYPYITYYLNTEIIRSVYITYRQILRINIITYYSNQSISNIYFNSTSYSYYGNNGFYCIGFNGKDNLLSLSGSIIYSGTSQGANTSGIYSIIPDGIISNNYDIKYIIGNLIIKKSIQN
jgi:hypothetical protein